MRLLITLLLLCCTTFLYAQDKGIYYGEKFSSIYCFLTYSDSTTQVEYFYRKGGQIFTHIPAKRLIFNMESSPTRPVFKSADDSISVFFKSDHFLIKRKNRGKNGAEKFKVYKSTKTARDITVLRNKHSLFLFTHSLYEEFKGKAGFDSQQFHKKLETYEIEKYLTLENTAFKDKLTQWKDDFRKTWGN